MTQGVGYAMKWYQKNGSALRMKGFKSEREFVCVNHKDYFARFSVKNCHIGFDI